MSDTVVIKAGELRDYIELEQQVVVPDDGGGSSTTYVPVEGVWAKVTPISSYESTVLAQRGIEASHSVKLRFYDGLDATWRLKFDGRYMAIVSVMDVQERQRAMLLKVVERKGKEDDA